jgi:hypothetical protein
MVWGQRLTRSRTSAAVQPWYQDLWLVCLRFRFQTVIALASRPSWEKFVLRFDTGSEQAAAAERLLLPDRARTDRTWVMAEHLAAVLRREGSFPGSISWSGGSSGPPVRYAPLPVLYRRAVPAAAMSSSWGTAQRAAGGARVGAHPRICARGGVDGGVRQRAGAGPGDL